MDQEKDNQRQAVLYAYLAGIIDGEGCIGLHKQPGRGQMNVRISVGMTHKRTCELLQETFGGNINIKERSNYPGAQQIYRWALNKQQDQLKMFDLIEPYIRIKVRQLRLARTWILTKKRNIHAIGRPDRIPDEEIQRREALFAQMKSYNAVGAAATTNWEDTSNSEVIV